MEEEVVSGVQVCAQILELGLAEQTAFGAYSYQQLYSSTLKLILHCRLTVSELPA